MLDAERERIERVAEACNVKIPDDSSRIAWALPILEALLKRIEALERDRIDHMPIR